MKPYWITLVFLLLFHTIQAQTAPSFSYQQELIKKSDKQYKASWILLGTGLAASLTSLALPKGFDSSDGSDNTTAIAVLGYTGFLSIGVSIPLFLASGRNARMAAKLSLESQAVHQPVIGNGPPRNLPTFTLKIPI
ncbi:hypothetical protein [Algoriphagus confluentis]|uniref:Uncharacterized protein n=1 Tax=Algoriphagus confluentis TaxID=1697556 RepID=A0ABQ6PTM4_9BACT|nr:hypothetical protein Aconfl_39580 [Algoriphagus confluentis]